MAMTIAPASLPALDSPRVKQLNLSQLPNRYSAYRMILGAEQHAVEQRDIMSARIVGYLLEFHERSHIFGDAACAGLVRWITSMPRETSENEHDVIYRVGTRFRDNLIRMFRTSNSPYKPLSSCPSRPSSFKTLEDMTKDALEATEQDYRSQKQKALARDGFRCMVTGMLDDCSVHSCANLLEEALREGINMVSVEAAHIWGESTMQGIDPEGISEQSATMNETNYATAMAMLSMLGFSDFAEVFRGSGGVHQVWNLLSLEPNLHSKFGDLRMWFEGTQKMNCYRVCALYTADEGYIRSTFKCPKPHVDGAPMVVDFTPPFEGAPPPPHPRLLILHAACARVARMSGAADFFDQVEWDAEEMQVLTSDRSSARLLSDLLSPFAAVKVMS